ncbi:MAG: NAD(P)-binding protein, partial [Caulobacteraceae bacterium]
MTDKAVTLDEALAAAHLPALAASLVHLTGDASLVERGRWPIYDFFGDSKLGGYAPERQAELRTKAKAAIEAHMKGAAMPPPPSMATLRKMMDFVAGAEIPDRYAPFLVEELQMTGEDARRPDWSAAKLKAAAAKTPVVIVGAGMSGLLAGVRLKEAGVPFTIVEKNADVGGTWLENVYP